MVSQSEFRSGRRQVGKQLHNLAAALDPLIEFEQSASSPRFAQARVARQSLHTVLYSGVLLNVLISVWLAWLFGKQITLRAA